jgi:nitrogenase subunit NifH
MIMAGAEVKTPADIIIKGRAGMDCVDCGGMEPGHGCGGRGVTLTIDTLQRLGMFQNEAYDAVVLDVLGDLVCGGFAAVLKKGVGEKVLVVVSGDFMSLFAANNICKAILAFWENGIYLTGLIANLAGTRGEVSVIHRFAKNLSTTVLGVIPHERLISEAEYHRQTVVEYRPGSKAAAIFKEIAKKVLSAGAREARKPTPMDDAWLQEFCREEFNFRSRRRGNRKGRT